MTTALARKFRVDVTSDLTLSGGWLELAAMQDFNYDVPPNLEDASAYDTSGFASYEKTFEEWTADVTVMRRLTGGVYDAGQELVRGRSVGQFGDNCRVGMRWYDRNGGPEAYKGVAIVGYKRGQTGVKNLDSAAIKFTGTDVPLTPITNPGVAATAPVLLSATPSAVAQGGIVEILGSGFTGVTGGTGVKFGATNATSYIVVSDQVIVAVMPAGSAGAANITVTNGVGTSAALAYTRGA